MPSVIFKKENRIGRVILNRPNKMNAINDSMPKEIENAIQLADSDPDIHVIILSGAGKAFCAGYDLEHYSKESETNNVIQGMPWDPMKDYQFMWKNTQHFMSLWRAMKPVICKIHGYAVAGGSDIALCSDMTVMADDAEIGYMPARVWGTPTTAMWVQRLGPERAKRMLFTGDRIKGKEAAEIGLVLKSVPLKELDEYGMSIILKNKDINLISSTTEKSVNTRHIADSAQTVDFIDNIEINTCTDLGSGAGLPGIVLAILMKPKNPQFKVILYEKSFHKSKFLTDMSKKFNLKKILVISDTHSFIDDKMINYVKKADQVWHAGDLGTIEVLEKIEGLRKTIAVYGNIDNQLIRSELKEYEIFYCEGVKVLMIHILSR